MSFVTTEPELLTAAAGDLAGIDATMNAENAAAATPTIGIVPAGADTVSALSAAQFAAHAELYQTVSAHAETIHQQFVSALISGAGAYAATEAGNAAAAH